MNQNQPQVHWSRFVYAVNPDMIVRRDSMISQTQYHDNEKMLIIDVSLNDNVESLVFTHDYRDVPKDVKWMDPEPPMEFVDRSLEPRCFDVLREDFKVKTWDELVGRTVVGLYFQFEENDIGKLIGMQRKD